MGGASYCIDASSLIKLKQDFPPGVFPAVWEKVEQLVGSDRLIAPDEVAKEIEKDDVLGPWAKRHKEMFQRLDLQQINLVKEIEVRFPKLAKPGKFGPAADAFVVALARLENQAAVDLFGSKPECVVVTEERGGPEKIPGACGYYKMGCVSLVELFQRESWVFR
jgi:hypothetical protein